MKWISTLLILLMLCIPLAGFSISASQYKELTLIGDSNPNQSINFIVWLKFRNKKLFDNTLKNIYTPGNKMYHHYLTLKDFNSTFFLTPKDIDNLKNYLVSQKFEIMDGKPSHFFMRIKGNVSQIEKTFHVKINRYRYQNKIFYANAEEPVTPLPIAYEISNITGLDNVQWVGDGSASKCIKNSTTPKQSTTSTTWGLDNSITDPLVDAQGVLISQMTFKGFIPGGTNGHGYTPAQIQQAYGVNTLIDNGIDGSNQTVRIVDSCISETLPQDFNAFQMTNWGSATNTAVYSPSTVGSMNYCQYGLDTKANNVAIAELTLDVEAVNTMAPNANIIVEWDQNWQTDLNAAASIALTQAIDDALADNPSWNLITVSHSEPENSGLFPPVDTALESAAGSGITVNISSGDCGDNVDYTGTLQVNYPSSSPYVTAVGATGLFLDRDNNYFSEMAWGTNINTSYTCYSTSGSTCTAYTPNYTAQGPYPLGFVEGTTGGISATYQAPLWQQNTIGSLSAGGYSGTIGSHQCSGSMCRAVPDISIFGEAHYPGFEVYMTSSSCTTSPCAISEGGTSLATPFFTGILALVNQERQNLGQVHGIGLAAQYLYNLPSGTLNIINNPHGMGNPVAGIPNPNAFQLFQVNADLTNNTPDLIGVVFNWDSSLRLGSTWNDITGVGSPIATRFVPTLANMP